MQVALGPGGVVEGISHGKGYVDMSTVDSATSLKIAEVWVPLFFPLSFDALSKVIESV